MDLFDSFQTGIVLRFELAHLFLTLLVIITLVASERYYSQKR